MFKHFFTKQRFTTTIDGVIDKDFIYIKELSANGKEEIQAFKIRVVDVDSLIELLTKK
jgi:hypothetical protein